jgi:hypothetical protein
MMRLVGKTHIGRARVGLAVLSETHLETSGNWNQDYLMPPHPLEGSCDMAYGITRHVSHFALWVHFAYIHV